MTWSYSDKIHESLSAIPEFDGFLQLFCTWKGISTMIIGPFFQGLFYGFGEGLAKIYIGYWMGIEPSVVFGGRKGNKF